MMREDLMKRGCGVDLADGDEVSDEDFLRHDDEKVGKSFLTCTQQSGAQTVVPCAGPPLLSSSLTSRSSANNRSPLTPQVQFLQHMNNIRNLK